MLFEYHENYVIYFICLYREGFYRASPLIFCLYTHIHTPLCGKHSVCVSVCVCVCMSTVCMCVNMKGKGLLYCVLQLSPLRDLSLTPHPSQTLFSSSIDSILTLTTLHPHLWEARNEGIFTEGHTVGKAT